MAAKKSGLGKGLDVIFMENDLQDSSNVKTLRISEIEPNKKQPRSDFNDGALAELAESIAKHGVLQPLLVRPIIGGEGYQIVAGERRWRACRMAGIQDVPVIIRDLNDMETMQIALIENLQREDLSPVEEAMGYKSLMDEFQFTQDDIAKVIGKSRPSITNSLRLLNLPDEVLKLLGDGSLSAGHARALLSLRSVEEMIRVADFVVKNDLSVRALESLVKKALSNEPAKKMTRVRDTFFDEVELSLKKYLGRKVKVSCGKNNKGVLEIEFFDNDDLATIARLLGKEKE